MNPYGREPGFGRRGLSGWLVPLVIGLALGALVFGGRLSMFGGFGPDLGRRDSAPRLEQPAPPQEAFAEPRDSHMRGHRFERDHGHDLGWGWFHGGFGLGRLLLPLLLIGGGLWLLSSRNRGGGWQGPWRQSEPEAGWSAQHIEQHPPQAASPSEPPAQPPYTPPGPTTGPTRML